MAINYIHPDRPIYTVSMHKPKHRGPSPFVPAYSGVEHSNASCDTESSNCWGIYGTSDNGCPQCDPEGYSGRHVERGSCPECGSDHGHVWYCSFAKNEF